MKCVAIIPARGGSKRIPRKNIKLFFEKPIIAYSIQAAKESGLFDRIIVSTDDEEIAAVAKQYGAEIPFIRPRELADDFTGTADVVNHCIDWLREEGSTYDYVCCIYATAPFIQANYLKQGFDILAASEKKFCFSVTSYPFPIQRAIQLNDGVVSPFFPEYMQTRSQDLVEAFHDAGQFYWNKTDLTEDEASLFPAGALPVVLPRSLVQDIDTEEDWHRAELMYGALQKSGIVK